MGNEGSSTPNDLGPSPDGLLFLVPGNDHLLLVTKDLLEVRERGETIATRVVSLEPSCACPTGTETFVIGFSNGTLSEFDSELNLINTFCLPGTCHSHTGGVVGVATCYRKELLVFSIGHDKKWNVWSQSGLIKSIALTEQPVCACACDQYAWTADKLNRMHVLDLDTMNVSVFSLPGPVTYMETFRGKNGGVIAVIEDGSVDIFSYKEVVAQFPPCDAKFASIMSCCANDGTVFYVTGNGQKLTYHMLEYSLGEVGKGVIMFKVIKDGIIASCNGRITMIQPGDFSKKAKSLPNVELPRRTICEFLNDIEYEN